MGCYEAFEAADVFGGFVDHFWLFVSEIGLKFLKIESAVVRFMMACTGILSYLYLVSALPASGCCPHRIDVGIRTNFGAEVGQKGNLIM